MALQACLRCEMIVPCAPEGFCLKCISLNEMEAYGEFTRRRCYPPDGIYQPNTS